MLKPKRKITRQEIKRDPFLETIDKLESNFEKNKKTFLNIFLGLIATAMVINFLMKKQEQKNLDSNSALGIAIVAYDSGDYENAKFQFESIISEFVGTNAFDVASFYLGRIYFENNDFVNSKKFLDEFMESANPQILCLGAIKMLTHIAIEDNNYGKALKLIDSALISASNNYSVELKLLKVQILNHQNEIDLARSILFEITSERNIPIHLKQKSEEFIGMM